MMDTLLLRPDTWDLTLDSNGNIALATEPYANAQDVASACKVFLGELYYDTSKGIPYTDKILGKTTPVQIIAAFMEQAALTVPDIVSARASIALDRSTRRLTGSIETINLAGQTNSVTFS